MVRRTVSLGDRRVEILQGIDNQEFVDLDPPADVIVKDPRRKDPLGKTKHLALLGDRKESAEMR